MAAPQIDRSQPTQTVGRRALVAAAGALVAATLANRAAQPVGAVNPPVLLGQDNPTTNNVATSNGTHTANAIHDPIGACGQGPNHDAKTRCG